MGDKRPIKPSDPRIGKIRFPHPTDPTKVIQIALVDTGEVDPEDNTEIWAFATGSMSGVPAPGVPEENKHYLHEATDDDVHALPDMDLVNGGVLIADEDNADPIAIGGDDSIDGTNGPLIPPGGSIPFSAQNLNQVYVKATTGDKLTFFGG